MKKHVGLLVIPSRLIARNLLRSEFLQRTQEAGVRWVVVTADQEDAELLIKSGSGVWYRYFHPLRANPARKKLGRGWDRLRYLMGLLLHMQMVHRFNIISGFCGFQLKLKQSWLLRKRYLAEGQPMSAAFGFPLPKSRFLLSLLKRTYYAGWQRYRAVENLFDAENPKFTLIAQLQTHVITPYVLGSLARGIPIFGINGSWDQPTTKGPLCPGLQFIFTQNEFVRSNLMRFHEVPENKIAAVGWVQMDAYPSACDNVISRDHFLQALGLNEAALIILFALNTPRLGKHELEIARALHMRVISGEFGPDAVLLLRCHPLDSRWFERWSEFIGCPRVVVDFPNWQTFDSVVASIRYSSVVICSAGSFYLDTLALQRPAIGLAWEDERLPYFDRPARSYEMEHLQSMKELGGALVKNELELVHTLKTMFKGEGMVPTDQNIRYNFFHELDGHSAERLAMALLKEVRMHIQVEDV